MNNKEQKVEPTTELGNSTKPTVMRSLHCLGDWIEDFEHENGNYMNHCIKCEHEFFGHKRRVICKECAGHA